MPGRIVLGLGNPALDSDADVISGSTLTAYQNGTTTLQAIYTSVTVATPLPNPLPADSAGRFFDIWAPNGLIYTFVWKDADGVIIRTWNDIVPLGSTEFSGGTAGGTANAIIVTVADFSSTDGELITFIATADNTGPTTAAVNGGTPIDIVEDTAGGPAALDGGEIVTGNSILLRYDAAGDQFHLVSRPLPGAQGTISPPTLVAAQNDWHPTGLDTAEIVRIVLTGSQTISGIDAPASDGRQLVLENIDTVDAITLLAESTASAAENRFAFASNIVLAPKEAAILRYDLTSARWRLVGRGFSGSSSYNSSKITANGSFVIPSDANAATVFKFTIVGGGGGGGGVATTDGAVGAGGGSGGFGTGAFTGFTPGQSITVAIGAPGAAGANTGAGGTTGGTTSLTYATVAVFSAIGGQGGQGATTTDAKIGGPTGSASVNIGASGLTEVYSFLGGGSAGGNSIGSASSGGGGSNPFGVGGAAQTSGAVGQAGSGYGSGGSGAYRDGANLPGGAGAAGAVLVEWWG